MKKIIVFCTGILSIILMVIFSCEQPVSGNSENGPTTYYISFTIDDDVSGEADFTAACTYWYLTPEYFEFYSSPYQKSILTDIWNNNKGLTGTLVCYKEYGLTIASGTDGFDFRAQFTDGTNDDRGGFPVNYARLEFFNNELVKSDNYTYNMVFDMQYNTGKPEAYHVTFTTPSYPDTQNKYAGLYKSGDTFSISFDETFDGLKTVGFTSRSVVVKNLKLKGFVFYSTNEDTPSVTDTTPDNAATSVLKPKIMIEFDKEMNTGVKDLYLTTGSITKKVIGLWEGNKVLTYTPDQSFDNDQLVWVDVPVTHKSSTGEHLPYIKAFKFTPEIKD
jgi:hypothetical protein